MRIHVFDEDRILTANPDSFPRRDDVERSNTARMRAIETETHTYNAFDGGPLADQEQGVKMLANFMAPQSVTLKVGAQVRCIFVSSTRLLFDSSFVPSPRLC